MKSIQRAIIAGNQKTREFIGNLIEAEVTEEQLQKAVEDKQIELYTEEAISQYMEDLNKSICSLIDDGNHTQADIDLEKAKKDMSKLVKRVITDKRGRRKTVYVKPFTDDEKKKVASKQKEKGKDKKGSGYSVGDTVSIKESKDMTTKMMGLKGQNLEVVGKEKGTAGVPEYLKVKDSKGNTHSINPNHVEKGKKTEKEVKQTTEKGTNKLTIGLEKSKDTKYKLYDGEQKAGKKSLLGYTRNGAEIRSSDSQVRFGLADGNPLENHMDNAQLWVDITEKAINDGDSRLAKRAINKVIDATSNYAYQSTVERIAKEKHYESLKGRKIGVKSYYWEDWKEGEEQVYSHSGKKEVDYVLTGTIVGAEYGRPIIQYDEETMSKLKSLGKDNIRWKDKNLLKKKGLDTSDEYYITDDKLKFKDVDWDDKEKVYGDPKAEKKLDKIRDDIYQKYQDFANKSKNILSDKELEALSNDPKVKSLDGMSAFDYTEFMSTLDTKGLTKEKWVEQIKEESYVLYDREEGEPAKYSDEQLGHVYDMIKENAVAWIHDVGYGEYTGVYPTGQKKYPFALDSSIDHQPYRIKSKYPIDWDTSY
jgi:hypothetical protein